VAKKKTKRPTYLSPEEALGDKKVAMLNRSTISTRSGWILTDGYKVSLVKQKQGEAHTASVEFTPREFAKFARWYLSPQKLLTVGKTGDAK
jgi:hypothetical protein